MNAVEIRGLSKVYPNGVKALDNVDLTIPAKSFYAILGPNGAGKSTAIGILTSLVNKTSGTVTVFGDDLDENPEAVKRHIGVVPQEFNFNMFEKVIDVVTTQAGYYGVPRKEALVRAEKYLKLLELWDKRDVMSRTLSGGMKRRLMMARAMMHNPELLILDEPTAGVDIEIRRSMWKFLKHLNSTGITIILTTHYLEEVERLCERVMVLDKGNVKVDVSIEDLLSKLGKETYILTTNKKITQELAFPEMEIFVNGKNIEVSKSSKKDFTDFFGYLKQQEIEVVGIASKVNRLEELFLELVKEEK